MAEERNLATARATDADTNADADSTKADLQRRMEEARESISQTVSEIKDTVTNQYQSVKESVNDALDWREQVRKRPVAWSAGALTAGLLVGYGLGSTFMGGDSDYERDYRAYDEDDSDDDTSSSSARYASYEGASNYGSRASSTRSYAAQGITGAGAYGRGAKSDYRPSYSSGYEGTHDTESDKPGLIEKFKGTHAFDRLQSEVSSLGDRFIDEISNVGQSVVLPALLGKVKELFGVDLSNKTGGAQQRQGTGTSAYGNMSSSGTQNRMSYGSSTSSTDPSRRDDTQYSASAGSNYGTSENSDYNTTSRDRDEYERGGSSRDRDDYGRGGSNYGSDRKS